MIVNILNMPFGGGKQFDTDRYEKSVMGRGHVIAQVAAVAQAGNTVVITLSDATIIASELEMLSWQLITVSLVK